MKSLHDFFKLLCLTHAQCHACGTVRRKTEMFEHEFGGRFCNEAEADDHWLGWHIDN